MADLQSEDGSSETSNSDGSESDFEGRVDQALNAKRLPSTLPVDGQYRRVSEMYKKKTSKQSVGGGHHMREMPSPQLTAEQFAAMHSKSLLQPPGEISIYDDARVLRPY